MRQYQPYRSMGCGDAQHWVKSVTKSFTEPTEDLRAIELEQDLTNA